MEPVRYVGTVRIPTDQYAYVEIEVEGTPTEIMDAYRDMKNAYGSGVGLPDKEWREALDRYIYEEHLDSKRFLAMSEIQQLIIQEIKKSKKRAAYTPLDKPDYGRISKESASEWRLGQGDQPTERNESEVG